MNNFVSDDGAKLLALLETARAWAAQDPDAETRAELTTLIELAESVNGGSGAGARTIAFSEDQAAAIADLHSRFDTRLAFGTAGLRGELGAGTNRMNRVLVAQAAAGIGNWLNKRHGQVKNPVVIGYDGRKNSDVFAKDSAQILTGLGVPVILLPRLLPTPVLAFAVRFYNASAGIMVTASHNPPRDNGYKVYLGAEDGAGQIIPPIDGEIAAEIDLVASGSITDLVRDDGYQIAEESVVAEFIASTTTIAEPQAAPVTWVYTAMHGVGWETLNRVIAAAGYSAPVTVQAQLHPDPNFSTVAFPNPEEPGALDLSFALANQVRAELIIANDPDADRLGAAIPTPNGWRRLTGNEVGLLLGWELAERAAAAGKTGNMAVSLVSSPALGKVAAQYGLGYVETPTGFKWIVRTQDLLYGYEEALGYLVDPAKVRDKDGISAALLLLSLASKLKAAGQTIADRLEQAAERFGFYASDQLSLRVDRLAQIGEWMAKLRAAVPAEIAGAKVVSAEDLLHPVDAAPASDILRYQLADGSRVIVRPSGTEPKLKVYLDVAITTGSASDRAGLAAARLAELKTAMQALLA